MYQGKLHIKVRPLRKEHIARMLRKRSTDAERVIWRHLRNRNFMGVKFRRQHPLGQYIVDFVSLEKKLVIELDGGQHNAPGHRQKDKLREHYLAKEGYRVLRFWNNEVFKNPEGIFEVIKRAIEEIM